MLYEQVSFDKIKIGDIVIYKFIYKKDTYDISIINEKKDGVFVAKCLFIYCNGKFALLDTEYPLSFNKNNLSALYNYMFYSKC